MYFKNSSLNYIPTTFGGEPKFFENKHYRNGSCLFFYVKKN
ncbi:hypothetical protein ACEN2Z_07515 [Staphylococcus aureus]